MDAAGMGPGIADASQLQQSQALKPPHLRNVYQKLNFSTLPGATNVSGFGLTHDGIDGGLIANFSLNRFDSILKDDLKAKRDRAAYIMCFDTGTAPAVGYTRTVNGANVNDAAVTNDWNILEMQPTTNVGLILKGTLRGVRHGLLYNRLTGRYGTDTTGLGPFTRVDLIARIQAGDTLTIMGVPPASRQRMAVDRDADGTLDGDEAPPPLAVALIDTGLRVFWPTNSVDVVLEFSESLALPGWKPETSLRNQNADYFSVTVPVSAGNRFYRLRRM
jgi:hypothetical protein